MNHIKLIFLILIFLGSFLTNYAQDADPLTKKTVLDGIKISGQWFVGYFSENNDGKYSSDFAIKRGYITISKEFDDHLSARLTQDISVDQEGDGIGDIELRIKYAYAKYKFNDWLFFTNPAVEFGVVHRPWLSFEQKINKYRAQGRMFFERVGLLSSADYGIYFESLLGGKVSEEYQTSVSKNYPGKYGSIGIGLYNGGGYNKLEYNNYKNVELRASLRPLGNLFPQLQLTYIGGFGKGNTEEAPDYLLNSGYISYEGSRLTGTFTYYKGRGIQNGTAVDEFGNSVDQSGYSGFLELKIHELSLSLIGRYDLFSQDYSPLKQEYEGRIVGIAYHFYKNSKILVSYDDVKYTNSSKNESSILEFTLELSF